LSDLYDKESLEKDYCELTNNYTLTISLEEVELAESETREQAKSRLWLTGRITASRFKAVCSTIV